MADLFELNTDISSNEIETLREELEGLKDEVDGFVMRNTDETVDVDPHDACKHDAGKWTIDMETEKASVVTDLNTCIERIQNIIDAIDCVKKNHTGLQYALQKECDSILTSYGFDATAKSGSGISGNNGSSSLNGGTYGDDGGYYGGGYGAGGGSMYSTGGASGFDELSSAGLAGLDELAGLAGLDELTDLDSELEDLEQETGEDKVVDVEEGSIDTDLTLENISYMYVESLKEGTESWDLFNYPNLIQYDENGYARLHPEALPKGAISSNVDVIGKEERYVVSCNSSIANVGDVLRFTQLDGSIIECVVGYNDNTEGNEEIMSFVINKESVNDNGESKIFTGATDLLKNIIKDNKSYEHIASSFAKVENKSVVVKGEDIIEKDVVGELV